MYMWMQLGLNWKLQRKLGGPIETMGESNQMYLSMNGHKIDNNNQLICTVQMITNIIINGLALMRVFDESVTTFIFFSSSSISPPSLSSMALSPSLF